MQTGAHAWRHSKEGGMTEAAWRLSSLSHTEELHQLVGSHGGREIVHLTQHPQCRMCGLLRSQRCMSCKWPVCGTKRLVKRAEGQGASAIIKGSHLSTSHTEQLDKVPSSHETRTRPRHPQYRGCSCRAAGWWRLLHPLSAHARLPRATCQITVPILQAAVKKGSPSERVTLLLDQSKGCQK